MLPVPASKRAGEAWYVVLSNVTSGDHIATTLPRRHGLQQIEFAVNHSDSRGPKNLVPREHVEVTVKSLHVHRHVRDGLGAIEQHTCAVTVCDLDHLTSRCDGSESV